MNQYIRLQASSSGGAVRGEPAAGHVHQAFYRRELRKGTLVGTTTSKMAGYEHYYYQPNYDARTMQCMQIIRKQKFKCFYACIISSKPDQ